MAGIAVCDIGPFGTRRSRDGTHIRVLPFGCRPVAHTGVRCARNEPHEAWTEERHTVRIGNARVDQRHVPGVGHLVEPAHPASHYDQWTGWRVRIDAIGGFLDVDTGSRAEVVAGIAVAYVSSGGRRPGHHADIRILARLCRAGGLASHVVARVERVSRASHGDALVIGDRDACERHVPRIRDQVVPSHRIAWRDEGSGASSASLPLVDFSILMDRSEPK